MLRAPEVAERLKNALASVDLLNEVDRLQQERTELARQQEELRQRTDRWEAWYASASQEVEEMRRKLSLYEEAFGDLDPEVVDAITVDHARVAENLRVATRSYHLVFTGNPGTGTTAVARSQGEIYHALGITPRAEIVEVGRAQLVGQFVGSTALKVTDTVERALGGILFIDEAYALTNSSVGGGRPDFGQEAVDTLVMLMEDHRDELWSS